MPYGTYTNFSLSLRILFMWETLSKTADCVYAAFKEANKWKNQ